MRKFMKFFVPMLLAVLVLLPVTQADNVKAASQYEDGKYNLSLSVLSESGGTSVAQEYLSSNATLNVNNGQNTLHITIAQEADMVKAAAIGNVKGSKSGSTLTFNNIDISQSMGGSIHVVVPKEQLPPNGYDKNHNVTYQFNNLSDVPTKGETSDNDNTDNEENGTVTPEENPPTGDNAPILFLTVVLLASGLVLVRKLAVK